MMETPIRAWHYVFYNSDSEANRDEEADDM